MWVTYSCSICSLSITSEFLESFEESKATELVSVQLARSDVTSSTMSLHQLLEIVSYQDLANCSLILRHQLASCPGLSAMVSVSGSYSPYIALRTGHFHYMHYGDGLDVTLWTHGYIAACSETVIPYSLYTFTCVTCEDYPQYGISVGKATCQYISVWQWDWLCTLSSLAVYYALCVQERIQNLEANVVAILEHISQVTYSGRPLLHYLLPSAHVL